MNLSLLLFLAVISATSAQESHPFEFTVTCNYRNGTTGAKTTYKQEGIVEPFQNMPSNITYVHFSHSPSENHRVFAVCYQVPFRGPAVLFLHPANVPGSHCDKHPIDTTYADHFEVRSLKQLEQACEMDDEIDPRDGPDTIYDYLSSTPKNSAAVANKNSSLLLTVTATDEHIVHGLVFKKPALYMVPKGFPTPINHLRFLNRGNEAYSIYFCADNPRAPVFSIKSASGYRVEDVKLNGITDIDIVEEPMEASRRPCYGPNARDDGEGEKPIIQ